MRLAILVGESGVCRGSHSPLATFTTRRAVTDSDDVARTHRSGCR